MRCEQRETWKSCTLVSETKKKRKNQWTFLTFQNRLLTCDILEKLLWRNDSQRNCSDTWTWWSGLRGGNNDGWMCRKCSVVKFFCDFSCLSACTVVVNVFIVTPQAAEWRIYRCDAICSDTRSYFRLSRFCNCTGQPKYVAAPQVLQAPALRAPNPGQSPLVGMNNPILSRLPNGQVSIFFHISAKTLFLIFFLAALTSRSSWQCCCRTSRETFPF